jgi:hypothetical protein
MSIKAEHKIGSNRLRIMSLHIHADWSRDNADLDLLLSLQYYVGVDQLTDNFMAMYASNFYLFSRFWWVDLSLWGRGVIPAYPLWYQPSGMF